jgi:hypothetical protein
MLAPGLNPTQARTTKEQFGVWVWFKLQLSVDKGYFGGIDSLADDVTGYLAALHKLHNRVGAQVAQLTTGLILGGSVNES